MPAPQFSIFILAGGQSSRFGQDKARARFQGTPLISHVAQTLQPYARSLAVIAQHDDQYQDLGLPTFGDLSPQLGPLGGLYTALHKLQEPDPWLFLTTCDFLGFDPAWLPLLYDHRTPESHALVFRNSHWQPLFAFYHRALLPHVQDAIDTKRRSVWRLLQGLPSVTPLPLPPRWHQATQINHPHDLQAHIHKTQNTDER